MDVHLVAVQARVEPKAYRSAGAFRERTLELAHRAVAGLPPREPRVVAFPEAYALPLVFWLDTPDTVATAPTALAAGLRLLGKGLRDDPRALLRRPAPDLLYHERMPVVWPVYREAFREAARATESYLVAGSLFGPLVDDEPARGLHLQGPASYNWLALFSPEGSILARIPKLRLTPDERKAFLSRGEFGPHVVHTRFGWLGVLICLDAFHEALIERVDAAGAWLLVQPSANAAAWSGPWTADPGRIEGDVWLQEGLAKQLRGRENLRYGLNPMLNGELYDLRFEGRSSVVAAGRHLSLADEPTGDAVVRATVERPAPEG